MRPYLLFLFIICAHTAAADSISVAAARHGRPFVGRDK